MKTERGEHVEGYHQLPLPDVGKPIEVRKAPKEQDEVRKTAAHKAELAYGKKHPGG
jgi:hypothetical protein